MSETNQQGTKQEQFKELYKAQTTPWDLGRPDFNLRELFESTSIDSRKALDVGCGSGHNSILLAQHGFDVTGTDVSDVALKKAEENASEANVKCTFLLMDFMQQDVPGAPFGFLFDRGCWHLSDSAEVRQQFAERVAAHLEKDGLWFAIIGSADEPPRGPGILAGPPRRSVLDIAQGVEPYFEILSIKASRFESNRSNPPKAWACLMRKRGK